MHDSICEDGGFGSALFVEATHELELALAAYREGIDRAEPAEQLQAKLRAVFQFAAESIFLLDEFGSDCVCPENLSAIQAQRA